MKKLLIAIVLVGIMAAIAVGLSPTNTVSAAGTQQTYLVLYKQLGTPADLAARVKAAGGTLVNQFSAIGVAVVKSADASFAKKMKADGRVEEVASTAGRGMKLTDQITKVFTADQLKRAVPAAWGDPLSPYQWDMVQIHAPEAQAINPGGRTVVVGDIDTGLDYTHPDLAANVDFSKSVSVIGGVPNTNPSAWMDINGHGTHTAGTIAAAANGIGIVGVAPNVKVAGIKAGNDDGYFFPEAVVAAFMWAATHDIDVVNNSYYADPWLFNSRNDAEQRAIWKAEQRAIEYAIAKGVVVVAAAGNENLDLSKTNIDVTSPDYPPDLAVPRRVTNAAVVIPVEIPGVIGVSGNGAFLHKAFYSSYGSGVIQVVAPGGDWLFQDPGDGTFGAVLSTIPGNDYGLGAGTSMASPHVAGVAALIISQFGKLRPGAVQALINNTADPQAAEPNPFDPGGTGDFLAWCRGGTGDNSFYGHGQVNAFAAVTARP